MVEISWITSELCKFLLSIEVYFYKNVNIVSWISRSDTLLRKLSLTEKNPFLSSHKGLLYGNKEKIPRRIKYQRSEKKILDYNANHILRSLIK